MESLQKVIVALRHQILIALTQGNELPASARLEAERVTVSLSFSIQEQKTARGDAALQFGVLPSSTATKGKANAPGHSLTLEFKVARQTAPENTPLDLPPGQALPPAPAQLDLSTADQLADSLASILGAPGFDSSGRSTVFRDALAGFSDQQARELSSALRGLGSAESSPEMAHVRHLLSRLADTGPAGQRRGRLVLADILEQHSVAVLLPFIKERWKTQEEWLG